MDRVGLIHVWQEVNSFSPRPTELDQFEEKELSTGTSIVDRHREANSGLGGFLAESSFEHVPIFAAGAWPGGPPSRETAETLLARLDDALAEAGQLDGALLDLHGAMACEGHPDMELEVVRRVRRRIGERSVAAILDLHANPSPEFVSECDVLIGYDTYPHVDMRDRGREAAALMREMLDGRRLCSAVSKLPYLTTPLAQASAEEPMRSLNDEARQIARDAGLVRVSLLPGFPYCDVERAGFSVVGIADATNEADLRKALDQIAAVVERRIEEFSVSRPSPREAVQMAASAERTPVVLADIADNIGGGGPGDGTALLAELLDQSIEGSVVTIADEEVAHLACERGSGARIDVELGAKRDKLHGDPVAVEGTVLATGNGSYVSEGQHFTGLEFHMGRIALLGIEGLQVMVSERAVPPFHAEQLTSLGVELEEARVITAKGAVAWRTAFGDIAGTVIEVDTPGVTPLDPSRLPRATSPQRCAASGA